MIKEKDIFFKKEKDEFLQSGWNLIREKENEALFTGDSSKNSGYRLILENDLSDENKTWISLYDLERDHYMRDIHRLYFKSEEKFFLLEAIVDMGENEKLFISVSVSLLNAILTPEWRPEMLLGDVSVFPTPYALNLCDDFIDKIKERNAYRLLCVTSGYNVELNQTLLLLKEKAV